MIPAQNAVLATSATEVARKALPFNDLNEHVQPRVAPLAALLYPPATGTPKCVHNVPGSPLMTTQDPIDLELLRRWRVGDREAGMTLVLRHYPSVTAFFRSRVRDNEDLIQETFARFLESESEVTSNVHGYLYGIARNVLADYLRRQFDNDLELNEASIESLLPAPPDALAQKLDAELLTKALRLLPDEERELLELRYWAGSHPRELAPLLGIPPATVRTRLFRARQSLRKLLSQLIDGQGQIH